jgi:hypothetical protein
VDLPHDQVQERRDEQGPGTEQEREPASTRVRHDPGRDLEQHLADGEERVGRERLRVAQAGIEKEERVDPQMNDAASVVSRVSSR